MSRDLEALLTARLDPLDTLGARRSALVNGDYDYAPGHGPSDRAALREAAVLIPIVDRPEGETVLLTLRASHLAAHAGQIAFPGGRLDPEDSGPLAAALREAREEIGLDARFVRPVGALATYETVTGFAVTPIVGLVEPGFHLTLDPREVADAFEIPFAFLMDEANHQRLEREWLGRMRRFYAMPYGERYVWGLTAGMLRGLYERLYL